MSIIIHTKYDICINVKDVDFILQIRKFSYKPYIQAKMPSPNNDIGCPEEFAEIEILESHVYIDLPSKKYITPSDILFKDLLKDSEFNYYMQRKIQSDYASTIEESLLNDIDEIIYEEKI